jgi:Tfp pilus assembly protein PilV
MRKTRQNGFVLILVIVAVAVIGIQMAVLGDMANTMQFQSNAAYLTACQRNLLASGLVWARENTKSKSSDVFDRTIQLDVSKLNIRDSALDIIMSIASDEEVEAQINTSCSRGRQTLKGTGKYEIKYVQTNKAGMGR